MTDGVSVDEGACGRIANCLSGFTIPQVEEEIAFSRLSNEAVGNLLFLAVAICHQTSPIGEKPLEGEVAGQYLKGWDYLLQKLYLEASADANILDPLVWRSLSGDRLQNLICCPTTGVRLNDWDERAQLVQDLGRHLISSESSLQDIYDQSAGYLLDQPNSLYATLAQFKAYSDPVRKKSIYLLTLMRSNCGWTYQDIVNLGAPVDYHEIRGHLRLGTVVVDDLAIRQKLKSGEKLTEVEDVRLREGIYEAILIIAKLLDIPGFQLHYLFWNYFRGVCVFGEPKCFNGAPKLPYRYRPLYFGVTESRCVFANSCSAVKRGQFPNQPNVQTIYY